MMQIPSRSRYLPSMVTNRKHRWSVCGAIILILQATAGVVHAEFTYNLSDVVSVQFPAPPKLEQGESCVTPEFSLPLTRLTDATQTSYKGIGHEYARNSPENADGTYLILRTQKATWLLYDVKKSKVSDKLDIGQGNREPRWDWEDPEVFYYIRDKRLTKYNIKNHRKTVLRDFGQDYPNAQWIDSKSEGDSSSDNRWWGLVVRNYNNDTKKVKTIDYAVYDLIDDKLFSYVETTGQPVDGVNTVTASMNGHYILVEDSPNTYVFDLYPGKPWSNKRTLPGRHGHGDLAISKSGRDVFVAQDTSKDHITMVYLDTLEEVKLLKLPFTSGQPVEGKLSYTGFHISGNNRHRPGWVLVSTYGRADRPTHWGDGALYMLELKENPKHWRLTYTFARTSKGGKDYFAEAFASINQHGTKVYWNTNLGITGKQYFDLFVLDLPPNWYDDLN